MSKTKINQKSSLLVLFPFFFSLLFPLHNPLSLHMVSDTATDVLSPERTRFFQFVEDNMAEFLVELTGYATDGRADEGKEFLTEDQIQEIFDTYSEKFRKYIVESYDDVKDKPDFIAGNWSEKTHPFQKNLFVGEFYREGMDEFGTYDLVDTM